MGVCTSRAAPDVGAPAAICATARGAPSGVPRRIDRGGRFNERVLLVLGPDTGGLAICLGLRLVRLRLLLRARDRPGGGPKRSNCRSFPLAGIQLEFRTGW